MVTLCNVEARARENVHHPILSRDAAKREVFKLRVICACVQEYRLDGKHKGSSS